jgi:hypothetical protein
MVGIQSCPEVGKSAQYACSPLADNRPATLIPRAEAIDWQVSLLLTDMVVPTQPVGLGIAAKLVCPLALRLKLVDVHTHRPC